MWAVPSWTRHTLSAGYWLNIAMALTAGVVLGATRSWRLLASSVVTAAFITVAGCDFLVIGPDGALGVGLLIVPWSLVAACLALGGMWVLVGGAAVVIAVLRAAWGQLRRGGRAFRTLAPIGAGQGPCRRPCRLGASRRLYVAQPHLGGRAAGPAASGLW